MLLIGEKGWFIRKVDFKELLPFLRREASNMKLFLVWELLNVSQR